MKISFDATSDEAKLIIQALQYAISQTNIENVKTKLGKVINEIKIDFWFDSTVFSYVHSLLDPYTNSPITLTSHLRNQLSIDEQWINNYLSLGCNKILAHLVKITNLNKTVSKIKSSDVKKCITVGDIVKLITKHYENAK